MGNALIKQGAKLIESAEDVALELRPLGTVELLTPEDKKDKKERRLVLPDAQARLFALVPGPAEGTVDIDALARQAGMSAGEALAALLELELSGLVRALPGKRYVRMREG
jgi:DNA processing protein